MTPFLEASIFQQRTPYTSERKWSDRSTSDHLLFEAPDCNVSLVRRTSYPRTFAYIKGSVLIFGYGPSEIAETLLATPLDATPEDIFLDNEFLYIAIDWRQKSIVIQADAFNTASVFVGTQQDRCIVTSDFGRTFSLLDQRQCTINKHCVARYLLSQLTYEKTFIDQVQLLYDRKRLQWSPRGTQLWLPPDATMKEYYRNRTGNAREFPQRLEQTLINYWQKYTGGGKGGCELSCGLDSSTVAGFLADQGCQPITATALFPGEYAHTQRQKLNDFLDRFNTTSITVPATHHLDYPWAEVLQGQLKQPFYHYCPYPYSVFFDDMYQALADQGVTTIFSGVGGDELFEHVDHRHVMNNTNHASKLFMSMPGFGPLVDYITRLNQQPTIQRPIPLASHSALTINAGDDRYLRYGLWAAHPLADPRLYAYMQTVPLQYCVDKLLLRIYAQARRVPKSIYLPVINEDFRDVDIAVGRQLDQAISYTLSDSILVGSGMLDRTPLLKTYGRLKDGAIANEGQMSLIFQNFLFAELNLRSLGVKTL